MPFIHEISNPSKIPKIKVYKSYKSPILFTAIANVFVLFLIIVNGLFPKSVMNFMETIGMITYTEATDARLEYVRDDLEYLQYLPSRHHHSSRTTSKVNYSRFLVGEYRDKDNNLYQANIYLFNACFSTSAMVFTAMISMPFFTSSGMSARSRS